MSTDIITRCDCGKPGCLRILAHGTPAWMCGDCAQEYAASHVWSAR